MKCFVRIGNLGKQAYGGAEIQHMNTQEACTNTVERLLKPAYSNVGSHPEIQLL